MLVIKLKTFDMLKQKKCRSYYKNTKKCILSNIKISGPGVVVKIDELILVNVNIIKATGRKSLSISYGRTITSKTYSLITIKKRKSETLIR